MVMASPSGEGRGPPVLSNRSGRALVLIAHGSRREASNREVETITSRLRDRARQDYAIVEHAFLELAEPGIEGVLEAVVARGAVEIVVVPYFLAAGRHVVEDVPAAVRACQDRHPQVTFRTTAHLGATEALAEALLRVGGGAVAGP